LMVNGDIGNVVDYLIMMVKVMVVYGKFAGNNEGGKLIVI